MSINKFHDKKIILASGSERRIQTLKELKIPYQVNAKWTLIWKLESGRMLLPDMQFRDPALCLSKRLMAIILMWSDFQFTDLRI